LGIAHKKNPTRRFAKIFWNNIIRTGRANELTLSISLYFMDGLVSGIKTGLQMLPMGLDMLKTKRLDPMGLMMHHGCKDAGKIRAMVKKARAIEDERKGVA